MTIDDMFELAKSHRGFLFWGTSNNLVPRWFAMRLHPVVHPSTGSGLRPRDSERDIIGRVGELCSALYRHGGVWWLTGLPAAHGMEEVAKMVSSDMHEFYEDVHRRAEQFYVVIDSPANINEVAAFQARQEWASGMDIDAVRSRITKAAESFVQIELVGDNYELRSVPKR